jgi:hypothetical protein
MVAPIDGHGSSVIDTLPVTSTGARQRELGAGNGNGAALTRDNQSAIAPNPTAIKRLTIFSRMFWSVHAKGRANF